MNLNKLQKIAEKHKIQNWSWSGRCHDCNCNVTVDVDIEDDGKVTISGGAAYSVEIDGIDTVFLKCDKCHAVNSTLSNFQPCEVYSRVVGYYRPIRNFNGAKQSEYRIRKNFKEPLHESL